jgi:hypothetical protein
MGEGSVDTRAGDLEAVRRIVTQALHGLPVRVFLFGSRARGDDRAASDIDVALLSSTPLPRDLSSRLREALEESHVPVAIELLDLSEAPASLRRRVLEEGHEWTGSEPA